MRILYTKAERGIESFDAGNVSEAREFLSEIAEELRDRLKMYEKVLELHGIKLPYVRSVNTQSAE